MSDSDVVMAFIDAWNRMDWDAVRDAFKHPLLSNDVRKNRFLVRVLSAASGGNPVPTLDNPSMVTLDAPDHTRLRKLDDGEYDALVLAAAGLARLGLAGRASEYLATEVCLPAAGQGALGIECRWGDDRVQALLEPLEDPRVAACVSAERTVSAVLGADCTAPLAAHATPVGDGVILQSRLGTADGRTTLEARGEGADPAAVGESVAASLMAQGAAEVLGGGD